MSLGTTSVSACVSVTTELCDLFAREWLACTLRSYPAHTQGLLRETGSPFRNPVGSALRAALVGLTGELFGAFNRTRVTALVDTVVRLRAVQDFTPSEVTGFVTFARAAATHVAGTGPSPEGAAALERVSARIEELTPIADECWSRCRDDLRAISERAARRRAFVSDRMQERATIRPAAGVRAASRGETS